jgi:hypothetical protein
LKVCQAFPGVYRALPSFGIGFTSIPVLRILNNIYMETMLKADKREGKIAKTIEEQTSKLPSDMFLWVSIGAMVTGLALQIARKKHTSLFIGQWVAPFLLFGIYNKLVKQSGHDKMNKG